MHLKSYNLQHSLDADILLDILDQTRAAVIKRRADLIRDEAGRKSRELAQKRLLRAVQMALQSGGDASACRNAARRYNVLLSHLEHVVARKIKALEREERAAKHRKARGLYASGLTPTQIAPRVGYSRNYVSKIVNGNIPKNKWASDL